MSCFGLIPLVRKRFQRRRQARKLASQQHPTAAMESPAAAQEPETGDTIMEDEPHTESSISEEEVLPMSRISEVNYVATGYCGLCRTQLPHNPLPVVETRNENWQHWEGDLRGVLCIDSENEKDCVITDVFRVTPDDVDMTKTVGIPNHDKFDFVNLKLEIALLENTLAYVVHSWCYDVLRWKSAVKDADTVYRLAKSLSHESSPWETIGLGDGWLDAPSRIKTLIGDMRDEESSKLQPMNLSKLPAELRAPIWGFVGTRSAYSSFLLVVEETVRLVPKLEQTDNIMLQLSKGSFISADKINMFGTSYLRRIGNVQSEDAVEIREDLTAIRIIASLAGICAMKLIGSTWESDWIGEKPIAGQIWYGTLKDPGMAAKAIFTGLTCLDIQHKPSPQLMWDRIDFPPQLMERNMLRDEAIWLRSNSTSRFEFIRYLPLMCGKEPAKGITFFCSSLGIIGLASHFQKTTYFSGYRDGLPTYISFAPGEGIKNIWYRLGEGSLDAPGMVIQTTKNRNYHVGPYRFIETQAPKCRWAPMNNFQYGAITGIFYQNPRREIYCCSVLGNGRSPSSHLITPPSIPHFPFPGLGEDDLTPGLFLSSASLANVQKIDVCRIGVRCVGLLVTYESGHETSLGQWYVPGTYGAATYEETYNKASQGGKGEPTSIRLSYLETQEVLPTVTRIEVVYEGDDSVVGENGILLNWNSSIQWLFSREVDSVAFCSDLYYEIPMEHLVVLQRSSDD